MASSRSPTAVQRRRPGPRRPFGEGLGVEAGLQPALQGGGAGLALGRSCVSCLCFSWGRECSRETAVLPSGGLVEGSEALMLLPRAV